MTLEERAKRIRAVALDGDGVLFTGRVFVDPERGEFLKERSHVDGQGISLLRAAGIMIAFVSGEKTGFVEALGKKLNDLPSVREGTWPLVGIFTGTQGSNKVTAIEGWLRDAGVAWEECAFMGDDVSDIAIMKKAGLAAAPNQAERIIKKLAHFAAERNGGDGAIRDLANLILEAKGVDVSKSAFR